MRIKGIDLSGYNPVNDYAAAGRDVDFVILKIIRKDLQPDKLFETHWAGFEQQGVPIEGVYNYTYATNREKFVGDAQRVIEVLAGRKTKVWLDVEWNRLATLSGRTLVDGIHAYAEVIQAAGLDFGIYSYQAFYNANLKKYADELRQYSWWMARYPSSRAMDNDEIPSLNRMPNVGQELEGWQYSSNGIVDGIPGRVDLNEWFVAVEAKHQRQDPVIDAADAFRRELAVSLGMDAESSSEDILRRTVTISTSKNRNHASVTALERLLQAYGYYHGEIEADKNKKPIFGNGMAKASYLYQAQIVGLHVPDREWTAGKKSYRTALKV
ncbi:MAG: hypothetical protein NC399_06355 [Muribaculum sp.]|nr:hypothetical protein [Muribaculum sp.]